VTKVDPTLDQLPADFNWRGMNGIARGVYKHYNAKEMSGLPVGVQVVGQRLEEEKVLALMSRIEGLLESRGEKYELISVLD
jgi:Asp-tRNA(Asn)/Glu-tRNA(Gln) amidotransferase A subunit family amidase